MNNKISYIANNGFNLITISLGDTVIGTIESFKTTKANDRLKQKVSEIEQNFNEDDDDFDPYM
jgi:hypothetical protein